MQQQPYSHLNPGIARQRGAALFMALIFLLILTILGVFGLNISRLENLMAGNAQFQTTALSNAEYVLVRGERDIRNIADTGIKPFTNWDGTGDQYYLISNASVAPTSLIWNWSSVTPQLIQIPDMNGDGSDTNGDGTNDDGTGEYLVANAGLDNSQGEDSSFRGLIDPLPGAVVQVFLISAQSESSRGAKRILQSVVVTDPLPP